MPAISASAPGKIILLGEHAVVYRKPAIAVPVNQVQAKAIITANPKGKPGSVQIQAPAIDLDTDWKELSSDHPIVVTIELTLHEIGTSHMPACKLRISSTIPVASGLGSGAAVTVAIIRAIATFLGHSLSDEIVSSIAYEIEKIHHGTPSGIDNTVVTYRKPVYFIRSQPIETLQVPQPFSLVIANTGIPSPTALAVGDVRQKWLSDPDLLESIFSEIEQIVVKARSLIQSGNVELIGPLLTRNHQLLRDIGVSSNELDRLVDAALEAGALGAKLSGGGRGGNMIALVSPESAPIVSQALMRYGAKQTILTTIQET